MTSKNGRQQPFTGFANRPLPSTDGIADDYWKAAAEGRLVIQYCDACETHVFPPRVMCPRCLSSGTLSWTDATGEGVVHAFSVVHRPPFQEFNDGAPYVVAMIELSEGVRMMSNVVGCDPDKISVGMAVEVEFEQTTDGALPVFVPASKDRPKP